MRMTLSVVVVVVVVFDVLEEEEANEEKDLPKCVVVLEVDEDEGKTIANP